MIFLLCAELISICLDGLKQCWVLKLNDFSAWFAVSEVLKAEGHNSLFQWQRSRRWRSCRCRWRTAHVCWSAGIWWLCPLVSSVRSATDAIPNSTPRETPERNWNWWQVGEITHQPYMKVNKNETSSWRHWSSLYSIIQCRRS